ncbi:MAG TPA: DUF2784 domain-containing protein [Verrucomicrobiae bacterium]|nr:DUF2784 domain-containing protein [Verrucomicrobiae bacterium]
MQASNRLYSLLADAILLVHFAFVAFVVLGFILIWIGFFCRWPFVRDLRFRLVHLAAMGFVLMESLAGFVCPLTTWENRLRMHAGEGEGYEGSFIHHWFGRVLFYDWSEQTFTLLYASFFLFVILTFWIVRPHRRHPGQRV